MTIWDKVKHYSNGSRILWDWLGEGGKVVDQETAQRRANVCLQCVHNQKGAILPKAVAWAVHEQLQIKNELNLNVEGQKELGTCEICTCENKLKIWREIEKIRAEKGDDLFPGHCWIITEP